MQIKSEEAFNTLKMLTSEGVNRDKKNLLAALLQTGIGTTEIQREIDSAKRFKRAFASIFIHAFSGAHFNNKQHCCFNRRIVDIQVFYMLII